MQFSRDRRKIDPSKNPPALPDGSPNDPDRDEIGPTDLAFSEWEAAGLTPPNLRRMREFRLDRLVNALHERDWGGILMFDPLNIRYATDSTNMQLWNTHNPFRACLVCADGYMVIWDYKTAPFLSEFNPLVKERRTGASMFYFSTGDRGPVAAKEFAAQVDELMRAHAPDSKRIGIDKIMIQGLRAFEALGYDVELGEELTEKTRAIKGEDEILAMRCAMHSCEASVKAMEEACRPGLSEDDVWAVLHAENIKRGGEWIETRLLTSGPRTNPWFQECGPRIIQPNEIVAFDTDLIGAYGMCCDISRTWWIGDEDPRPDMIEDYQLGMEHIERNMELMKPGAHIRDIIENMHNLPPIYQKQKYSTMAHGVGLCDEWPHIDYPDGYHEGAFDYHLEPGMMLCVEALISRENGDFSIKLEDQILITETGYENLTRYPWDERLMGH